MKRLGKMSAVVVLFVSTVGLGAAQATDVLVIVDSSGSMSEKAADGLPKIEAAKKALADLHKPLRGHQVGMVMFGHRKDPKEPGSCQDIEQVLPFASFSAESFGQVAGSLVPKGSTPLAGSLLVAQDILLGRNKDTKKEIILVTDGNETCGGSPAAVAAQLRGLGINVRVHVVGFGVADTEKQQLAAIARHGGGLFAAADDTAQLRKALTKVVEVSTRVSEPYFFDDFNRDALGERWQTVNEDEDGYIVEDGTLLAVASAASNLAAGDVSNVFVLNQPMPKGDWVMTMKFRVDVQTAAENVFFGLYQDKQNYTLAEVQFVMTWGSDLLLNLHGVKNSRGKETRLNRDRAWVGPNGPIVEQAKTLPQPLFLRVEKRGRSYLISGRISEESNSQWIDVGKLTALRAKGNLAIGINQRKAVNGESSMKVDWVKIETIK